MKRKINILLWIVTFVFLVWDFLLMVENLTPNEAIRGFLQKNVSHIIWQPPMSNDFSMLYIFALLITCVVTYPAEDRTFKKVFWRIFVVTFFYGLYRFILAWIGLDQMATMLHNF